MSSTPLTKLLVPPRGLRHSGSGRSAAFSAVIIAALALHATLWWISSSPQSRIRVGDEEIYWQGATLLSAGEVWHPDPLWPPLYPRFLAAVLGTGGGLPAIAVTQVLMLLAVALLLRDLTRHLTGSRFAGDVASGLTLVYPPLAAYAHYLWPEVLHLFLFTGALWILVRRSTDSWPWLVGAGVLLGLALLTKSLLGPFLPLLLLPLATGEGSFKRRALKVLLVAVTVCAVIAPTAISNRQRATDVVVSDSLAFNLWVGLNDRSRKDFVDIVVAKEYRAYNASAPTFPERNAILWAKIKDFAKEHGTLEILRRQLGRQPFRLLDKDSFLTDMLPGGAIAVLGYGYRQTPSSVSQGLRGSSYLMYAAILIGTAAGMAVCPPRRRRWLIILLVFFAYNLAIFLLLHVKSRYRIQLLPVLFLYSGCAAAWTAYRLGFNPAEAELWSAATGHRAWCLSLSAAMVLLLLAFGRTLF